MKILHLISSGGMYGAEAVILNLMRTLRGGPHTCALGVFLNEPQSNRQLYERSLAEGFETQAIRCRGQVDRAVPGLIRNLAHNTGADVVHAHGYKADVYLSLALIGERPALVSTCHTWYDNNLALRLYGTLDRFMLRRYHRVAAVSGEVAQRLLKAGLRSERVSLIRNGIDTQRFDLSAGKTRTVENPLRVGLVGRLDREKGIDIFLRAAAGVLNELPGTQFIVVGEGPDRAALERLLRELGLGANASLHGHEEDMPSFYASIHLMVSASLQEGLPIALLEAMASGLAVVATAVGAVPDAVRPGVTGLLVDAGDVSALTKAMLALLRDAATRVKFGATGKDLVEREFSAKRMATDYIGFYELALQHQHDRAA